MSKEIGEDQLINKIIVEQYDGSLLEYIVSYSKINRYKNYAEKIASDKKEEESYKDFIRNHL